MSNSFIFREASKDSCKLKYIRNTGRVLTREGAFIRINTVELQWLEH